MGDRGRDPYLTFAHRLPTIAFYLAPLLPMKHLDLDQRAGVEVLDVVGDDEQAVGACQRGQDAGTLLAGWAHPRAIRTGGDMRAHEVPPPAPVGERLGQAGTE